MKILILNLPFSTPISFPYSIAKLYSNVKENFQYDELKVLDLNAKFHRNKYPKYYQKINSILRTDFNQDKYDAVSRDFQKLTNKDYAIINKNIISYFKSKTELNEDVKGIMNIIENENADMIVMSLVYSSQNFVAKLIVENMKDKILVTGGPAVNEKIKQNSLYFKNYEDFVEYFTSKRGFFHVIPDFSIFDKDDYLTSELVIPIKTSNSCYYRACSFCTHHNNEEYKEYEIENIEKEILFCVKHDMNNFFLIDDAIPKKRLETLSNIFEKYHSKWMCQLRIQNDFDDNFFKKMYDSGLRIILWGIESGNNRILRLMRKGTSVELSEKVLALSKKNNIKNIAFIMFGFPTETREEFDDTINFLKNNDENIDLVSTSIFGLQENSFVYNHPKLYQIENITKIKRTILKDSIHYDLKIGLSQEKARFIRKRHKKTLDKINKWPKAMNFFREHMLLIK